MFWLAICPAVISPALSQDLPAELNVIVVSGEGAINNIGQRAPSSPAVEVRDEKGKPVAGAAVVFTLPTAGSSGEFSDGSKHLTVMTDAQGRAVAKGLKANSIPGKVPIHVNVSYRGLTARVNITQFNMAVPGRSGSSMGTGKKVLIFLAVAAAGAAGGVYAITRNGNNSSPASPASPPIVVSPGSGTVGPPH
jgi:hypothetical protein